jgi:bacterioferritin (cytochrome b1)
MSPSYADLKGKIEQVKTQLETCANRIEKIEPTARGEYPNPHLRSWSGDVRQLEEFAAVLEEWLSHPLVAEAKRYLLDLKKWSGVLEKISLEEVEKDWRFLSDNVGEMKEIHGFIGEIGYEAIKKIVSSWVLSRVIEKDVEKARKWATNANNFAISVKQLGNKPVESKLAHMVISDAVKELLKTSSFDTDNKEAIKKYVELVDRSENMVKNRPVEIKEEAILRTYKMIKEIGKGVSTVVTELGIIKRLLVDLEWVEEFPDFQTYEKLWTNKHTALKKNDLESIDKALRTTQLLANDWKEALKKQIDGASAKIRRMSKSVDNDNLKKEVASFEEKKQGINWDKPNLKSLSEVLSQVDSVRERLRRQLINRLKSEDATLIIEEREMIEDLGENKGWDFERFIKALEVVLRNGLIVIRAAEEK